MLWLPFKCHSAFLLDTFAVLGRLRISHGPEFLHVFGHWCRGLVEVDPFFLPLHERCRWLGVLPPGAFWGVTSLIP